MADLGIGARLRTARQESGKSLEEIARATRVRPDYLRALEDEEFALLGGDVYAKGFLKSYAQELGLDPEELLVTYRARIQGTSLALSGTLANAPVARAPRGAPPKWVAWSVVAVVVLIGIVVLANSLGGRSPQAAEPRLPDPVVTPSQTPTPTPSPTPAPTPSPVFEGVHLELTFEQDCWVRVFVDGKEVEQRVINQGDARLYQADAEVVVEYGNPGGVVVTLNGEDLGAPGQVGVPVRRTYTEDGVDVEA